MGLPTGTSFDGILAMLQQASASEFACPDKTPAFARPLERFIVAPCSIR